MPQSEQKVESEWADDGVCTIPAYSYRPQSAQIYSIGHQAAGTT